MPAAFGPTRPRSRAKSCRRPIRTYVGTTLPAWQPQPTNWCHGLTAESDTGRLVGQHHCAAENGPSVSFFPLWPPFYDSDGPGEAWNGSGRSRGPSLRPEGVRTVPRPPTARAWNPRRPWSGGKGLTLLTMQAVPRTLPSRGPAGPCRAPGGRPGRPRAAPDLWEVPGGLWRSSGRLSRALAAPRHDV